MKNRLAAVIFDFDGTVVDNEQDWEDAFSYVLSEHDLYVPEEMLQKNGWMHEPGAGLEYNWKRIVDDVELRHKLVTETVESYISETKTLETVLVRESVDSVIEKAKELELFTALCTGNTWHMVEQELEMLQLTLAFDVTTTGEEVMLQKPDPEIYLLSAQKLGVEPEQCLVVEDAIVGVRSACEAGCKVVGLVSEYASAELLRAAGAEYTVNEMSEVIGIVEELMVKG